MANRDELIQQFSGMTGASADQAKFFLEMAGWELKVAVDQFYELGEGIGAGPSQGQPKREQTLGGSSHPVAPVRPQTLGGSSSSPAAGSSSSKSRSTRSNSGNSKLRTLNDLNRADSADDSDDEHQNLYAGGEKSGMVVQGPNKHSDLINQILKKAAQGGPAPEEEDGPSVRKPKYFKGSGYKLGSEEEPSQLVNPTVQSDSEDELLEPVTRYLTFWRNGFSVDDGPLYRYDDPANQTMLNAINSGRAPLSLLNVRHGQPVDVRVARRQDEDYVPPPKAPPKPFEGAGHRLGSPAAYSPGPSTPGAFPSSSSSAPQTPASTPQMTLDESQPTTSVQIRLADGTKLVSKFNHTHTVGDIRRYIDASRPTNRAYILQTTFPVKQLTDDNCTLKDAGLLNSVVVQRYQ